MASPQYVYVMNKLSKTYDGKQVLKDIWLSFFRAPRSAWSARTGPASPTLLQIMAGIDKDFDGTATLAKGMRVRYGPGAPVPTSTRPSARTCARP